MSSSMVNTRRGLAGWVWEIDLSGWFDPAVSFADARFGIAAALRESSWNYVREAFCFLRFVRGTFRGDRVPEPGGFGGEFGVSHRREPVGCCGHRFPFPLYAQTTTHV